MKKSIGAILREARKRKDKSPFEIERMSGGKLRTVTIREIETGGGYTIDKLCLYADLLGIELIARPAVW